MEVEDSFSVIKRIIINIVSGAHSGAPCVCLKQSRRRLRKCHRRVRSLNVEANIIGI